MGAGRRRRGARGAYRTRPGPGGEGAGCPGRGLAVREGASGRIAHLISLLTAAAASGAPGQGPRRADVAPPPFTARLASPVITTVDQRPALLAVAAASGPAAPEAIAMSPVTGATAKGLAVAPPDAETAAAPSRGGDAAARVITSAARTTAVARAPKRAGASARARATA